MKKLFVILSFCLFVCHLQAQFTSLQVVEYNSPKNDVRSISFDKAGNMFVATYAGIYKQVPEGWKLLSDEDTYLESFIVDKTDNLWMSGWGKGVYRADKETQVFEKVKGIPTSANVLFEDAKGRIWAGMWRDGLMMGDQDNWTNFTTKNCNLADNSILSVACDSNNKIWIGTYQGLSSYDGSQWSCYTVNNSRLPDYIVYALATGKNDRVWAGTCKGVALFNKKGVVEKVYDTSNSPLSDNVVISLLEDSKGRLWVGTWRGLDMFDGTQWKRYTVENSNLPDNKIQVLQQHGNKLYVGTSLGISVMDIK
ncbi:ligand-binding sensor domain-containing protein [Parabacteroides chinchillae]|uniref:Two component regulator propeller n=1 Tax=Parabacteroides chinchillae TaxID=871327 RepID=A0A8G2BVB6_9BACT|nr:two-component regulator propeller domain-containing protein [Parabacteroides chinchillae]SEF70744.1 Two component regulator propeller [Parabacteroides chinchillae]